MIVLGVHLRDWDMVTVGRYVAFLENSLQLKQVQLNRVWSFRVPKSGISTLITQKTTEKEKIGDNRHKLACFRDRNKSDLSVDEINLIGCLINNYDAYLDILDEHINAAVKIRDIAKVEPIYENLEESIPF